MYNDDKQHQTRMPLLVHLNQGKNSEALTFVYHQGRYFICSNSKVPKPF